MKLKDFLNLLSFDEIINLKLSDGCLVESTTVSALRILLETKKVYPEVIKVASDFPYITIYIK